MRTVAPIGVIGPFLYLLHPKELAEKKVMSSGKRKKPKMAITINTGREALTEKAF